MNDNRKLEIYLTIAGVGMMWICSHQSRLQIASRRWPSVTGKVTEVGRKGEGDYDTDGYSMSVSYEDTLADKRYTGSRSTVDDIFR